MKITVSYSSAFTDEEALDIAASAAMWNKEPNNVRENKNTHIIGHSRRINSVESIPYHAHVTIEKTKTEIKMKIRRAKDSDYKRKR